MILVVGATGMLGSRIVRQLLDAGEAVRILVRVGANYQLLVEAGAQPVIGDLKDPATLVPACRDVSTVITTASAGTRGGADTPHTVDWEGTRNLIDAASEAGVRQFVFVSSIAADENSPLPVLQAKAKAEAYLRASGIPFTILASLTHLDILPLLVVGGPARAGQPVTLVGEGRRRHSLVAAQDVAAFAVAVIGHSAAINQRLAIGGPEAISFQDIVAAYERALGQPLEIRSISPGEPIPGLPPVPGLAELATGLMAALDTFDMPIPMADTARTFDVELTGLDELIRRDLASMPASAEKHQE